MFRFTVDADKSLLTATREGEWSLKTVNSYEMALRIELENLQKLAAPTHFIIDIRSSGPQTKEVADALREMVSRLGPLRADRTAIVTSSGLAKLQALRVADDTAQVFTSLVLARDWILLDRKRKRARAVIHDVPSSADAEGRTVHVHGPSDLDINLTPQAALETAKRIGKAASEALI